jgi:hypothetical protein
MVTFMSWTVRFVVYFALIVAASLLLTYAPQRHAGEDLNHMQQLVKGLMYMGLFALAAALAMDLVRRLNERKPKTERSED